MACRDLPAALPPDLYTTRNVWVDPAAGAALAAGTELASVKLIASPAASRTRPRRDLIVFLDPGMLLLPGLNLIPGRRRNAPKGAPKRRGTDSLRAYGGTPTHRNQ